MGFFFQTEQTVKRGTRQKRNAESLQRIGCAACPLNKITTNFPKMEPTLSKDTWVYFLGEGPGRDESENSGRPFTGQSGQWLRRHIPDEFYNHVSFDNVINCRATEFDKKENRIKDRTPTPVEVSCCYSRRIKYIEQAKPKVIVALGIPALNFVLNSSDMIGMRGRVFVVKIGNHTCYFLPTYHPAFILRRAREDADKRGRKATDKVVDDSFFGRTVRFDLKKAFETVKLSDNPIVETEADIRKRIITFERNEDFDQLLALLARAKQAPYKAIDIETTGLRPYAKDAKILSVALSFNINNHSDSCNISFALDHPKARWNSQQRRTILDTLKEILIDDTIKIAHHSVFELEWFIAYFGEEVVRHEVWECSQLQAHFLDERRGAGQSNDDNKKNTYQSLGFLVKMHFGVPFKQWFEVDRKNMLQADLTETLVYNAADSLFTLRLWGKQRALLNAEGLFNACMVAMPRQATCALTQSLGIPVNQAKTKELQRKLADQISVLQAEIEGVDVVQQYIKEKPVKYKDKDPFNPMGEDAIVLFRDYLKREEIQIQDGKKVRWSVDKRILEKIDHPLAELIVSLRNKSKMKSTYVDGLELGKGKYIWPDGKIHCNFNATFTTTGRFSSDELNMQNFPHRNDSWVREQIEAPDGHVIVAADYGQLEMCGAAMCSKDPALIKVLWDDYDTHFEWASKLAAICPTRVGGDFSDAKVAKSFRSIVKNKLVFPAIYGASNKSIAGYLGIDEHYIDTLMDEFWDTFKGVKQWQNRLLKEYRETGWVASPTGRRRHHPLTTNEAINAPIQCLASEIVVDGMCRLSYMAATTGKWYLHPLLNIHDDLSFIIPEKKLVSSIETIYKTMLTPSFGEGIVNVPLSVTVSVGKNWFSMDEIGKFWSHKDVEA